MTTSNNTREREVIFGGMQSRCQACKRPQALTECPETTCSLFEWVSQSYKWRSFDVHDLAKAVTTYCFHRCGEYYMLCENVSQSSRQCSLLKSKQTSLKLPESKTSKTNTACPILYMEGIQMPYISEAQRSYRPAWEAKNTVCRQCGLQGTSECDECPLATFSSKPNDKLGRIAESIAQFCASRCNEASGRCIDDTHSAECLFRRARWWAVHFGQSPDPKSKIRLKSDITDRQTDPFHEPAMTWMDMYPKKRIAAQSVREMPLFQYVAKNDELSRRGIVIICMTPKPGQPFQKNYSYYTM